MTRLLIIATITVLSRAQDAETDISVSQSWLYGMLTGFGVSLIGFLSALLLVSCKKCVSEENFKTLVKLFYALGCGALLGDATIHILPEAYKSSEVQTEIVSLVLILAIVFFLTLERVFEAYGVSHEHWGKDQKHQHPPANENAVIEVMPSNENLEDVSVPAMTTKEKSFCENLKGKGSQGYLNLFSSLIHNFMDGFGIGVSFASLQTSVFVPILIAVFAHEVPREMGDVAILMKNGFTGIQTILCNGFINFNSLIGVVIGLAVGSLNETVNLYILVAVAGNFLYIAADIWRHLLKNKGFGLNFLEFSGFALGVGAMFLVLLAES